jgi:phosphatidylglycerol:prolipoprotein diacylglycerol transferase
LIGYGGILGGLAGSIVYLRFRGARVLPWADVAAPSVAIGIAITRIGSYLLGSGYGVPVGESGPAWLKRIGTFPRWPEETLEGAGSPAWVQHVNDGLVPLESSASLPVHPTQLYGAAGGLVLLALLLLVRRRQSFRGQAFLVFVFAYGLMRFLLELWRGDPQRGLFGPYVSEHYYVPLTLLMFAAAFGLGPARSIQRAWLRRTSQGLFVLPAVIAYLALAPGAFASDEPLQLSTSQYVGLLSAIAAAVLWGMLAKAAEMNPEQAMSPLAGESWGDDEDEDAGATADRADDEDAGAIADRADDEDAGGDTPG